MSAKKTDTSNDGKRQFWHLPSSLYRDRVLLVGLVLVVMGGYLSFTASHGVHPTAGQAQASRPDETKPDSNLLKNYAVPADQPRSIRIESAGVNGLVQSISLTRDNAVGVPTNIHFAGWYTYSALPGKPGLSIIDGHVSGTSTDAIFKQLGRTKPNDIVEVEFGDKRRKKFVVVETKTVPENQASQYMFTPKPDIASQLNLVTCGGSFDQSTQRYADRIIVTTKLISS